MSNMGGHCGITHVDRGALEFFRDFGHCKTMLDVGCGPGGQVQMAQDLGYSAIGIDGDPALAGKPGVLLCDLTKHHVHLPTRCDLVWCVEVAEHIEMSSVPRLLETCVGNCRQYLVFTASQNAGPKWHVTLKPMKWWSQLISAMGMQSRPDILNLMLAQSTMEREFLKENGRVYSW